jgi:hypothetical protein
LLQQGGHDAVHQATQLRDCELGRGPYLRGLLVENRVRSDGQSARLKPEQDEVGLQPVVQVAGDASALLVACRHYPGPRLAQRGAARE